MIHVKSRGSQACATEDAAVQEDSKLVADLPLPKHPMTSPSPDSAVHTENLTKVYKDFWGRDKVRALDDLNLTIHRGEVFGLLGPNGSGKTTTIKLLLGLIFPTAGTASRSGPARR